VKAGCWLKPKPTNSFAQHLALVTQCLLFVTSLMPHVRAALMAQLPRKQHALLNDLDKIKQDFAEHFEKVLGKFVAIVGSIVENGLVPSIGSIDFDNAATQNENENENTIETVKLSNFFDGIVKNISKLHQVLVTLLPSDQLLDVFVRIFNYVNDKIVELLTVSITYGGEKGEEPAQANSPAAATAAKLFKIPKVSEQRVRLNGWPLNQTKLN